VKNVKNINSRKLVEPLRRNLGVIIDLVFLILIGFALFRYVIPTPDSLTLGDDATLWAHYVSLLSQNLPLPTWDSCCSGGYPVAGIPFFLLLPASIAARFGIGAVASLNDSFMLFFILLGISVYYLARRLKAPRVIAVIMPLLVLSTNTQWNATIWGGSYDRFFSLPLLFFTVGATFRMVNGNNVRKRDYVFTVTTWTLTLLSNLHIAVPTMLLATVLLVLSPDSFKAGLRRLVRVLIPSLTITAWYWTGILQHLLVVNGQYAFQYNLTPNQYSWLVVPGGTWQPTLNYAYLPLIASSAAVVILARTRGDTRFLRAEKVLIAGLSTLMIYYLVEGWIPQLWAFLPRFESTFDSVASIGYMAAILLATLTGSITLRPKPVTIDGGMTRRNHCHTVLRAVFPSTIMANMTRGNYYHTVLKVVFLSTIIANAVLVIPSIQPVNWNTFNQTLDQATCGTINCSSANYQDYRLATTGRTLTRWFPLLHPDIQITGIRSAILDSRPGYSSWFDNVVLYRGDLNKTGSLYVEDQPGAYQPFYMDSPTNVATTIFWLDWLGARNAILLPDFQPSLGTMGIYDHSSYLNTILNGDYKYRVYGFSSALSGPIAQETNASTVGFLMGSQQSSTDWKMLLASLSYLGLGPSYVIPLIVNPGNLESVPINSLITDWNGYIQNQESIHHLTQRGVRVLLVGVTKTQQDTLPVSNNMIAMNETLSEIVSLGPSGSYLLTQSLLPGLYSYQTALIRTAPFNATQFEPQPGNWSLSQLINTNSTLTAEGDIMQLSVNLANASSRGQTNIMTQLPTEFFLPQTSVSLQVKSNVDLRIGLVFPSGINHLAYDTTVQKNNWTMLNVPARQFDEWGYPNDTFNATSQFVLVFNIPPNAPPAQILIRGTSIRMNQFFVYRNSSPVENSGLTLLKFNGTGTGDANITLSIGDLFGAYMTSNPTSVSTVVPLASFVDASTRIASFDAVISSENLGSNITLLSPVKLTQTTITAKWPSADSAIMTNLVPAFRGVLWKETDSPNWVISTVDQKNNPLPVNYYSAGPGMIYIPITANAKTVSAKYTADSRFTLLVVTPLLLFLVALWGATYLKIRTQEDAKTQQDHASKIENRSRSKGTISHLLIRLSRMR